MLSNIVLKLKNTMDGYKNTSDEFIKDQRGVTAIEYAIIGVAVSAIVLAVFNGDLGTALQGAMGTITSNITAADGGVITN
ncbi:Flp family type IVb pilin [Vibrio marisflavi]|uniref:Flp/Fap pilin component n=1 Tax=Vibrio marisflavi CECT 7928 TaxID=634439 RepID=A0ABM9A5Q0_9VIBR|nr:Flp family type IVb pilin [Vibrio marisflavi]CAH0540339.1 hypothetical protein VMF7928_02784 [Vibrio marisflavi CECT 7928]